MYKLLSMMQVAKLGPVVDTANKKVAFACINVRPLIYLLQLQIVKPNVQITFVKII